MYLIPNLEEKKEGKKRKRTSSATDSVIRFFFFTMLSHAFLNMIEQENTEEQKLHYLNSPYICCFGTSASLNILSTSLCKNERSNFSINQYLLKIICSIKFKNAFLAIILIPLNRTFKMLYKH